MAPVQLRLSNPAGGIEELRLSPTEISDCRVTRVGGEAVAWWHDRMGERSEPFGTDFERDGAELVVSV